MSAFSASRRWISDEYHDLNGTHLDCLPIPPTSLEFSRLVRIGRPVVIKGFRISASKKLWTDDYLQGRMGDQDISIAVSPSGNADAVALGPGNMEYFVEPYIEKMTMGKLFSLLSDVEDETKDSSREVYYLQSQNGNLYSASFFSEEDAGSSSSEFEALRCDVPSDIDWCSEALDKKPDAVNLWIGDNRSTTSIHTDPYDNIYTVVRGRKHFTLLPPTEGWSLKERVYPHAVYVRDSPGGTLRIQATSNPAVRWPSVDPISEGALPDGAHPIYVNLEEGDTLYLPAGWWHHVRQSSRCTIAVNWWYDTEMRGLSWVMLSFLRGVAQDEDVNNQSSDSA